MKKTVESFLYPDEVLRENQNVLLDRYSEDYGEEYRSIIENRMKNTLYLFDSNPILTMQFLDRYGEDLLDSNDLKDFKRVFFNYQKHFDMIHKRMKKKYYEMLASYFSISSKPIREELFSLDIESYSFQSIHILTRENVSFSLKEEIRNRQKNYQEQCKEMGVSFLTNPVFIQFLLDEKKQLEEKEFIYLLKNTIWGRRIYKKIKTYYPKITILDIMKIMRDDAVAITSYMIRDDGRSPARVMYYPLIQNYSLRSLDRVFYHENRHVIESNPFSSGLHQHVGERYHFLNEVRTEKNALLDMDCFPEDFMWSSDYMVDGYHNTYEELFSYLDSFLEDNRELLNDLAIRGDFYQLEELFGKELLDELETFLCKMSQTLKENHFQYSSSDKMEEAKLLVKRLNHNFHRQ